MTVPNNPSDTATFVTSNTTTVSLSAATEVNTVVFGAGASEFTIRSATHSQKFQFFGAGIVNNSGKTQTFVSASPSGVILFTNSAAAGSDTMFFMEPSPLSGPPSFLQFNDSSSADHGTFFGVLTTLAGLAGSQGNADGTGGDARFNHPTGVATDSVGNVYVADRNNHTIRRTVRAKPHAFITPTE